MTDVRNWLGRAALVGSILADVIEPRLAGRKPSYVPTWPYNALPGQVVQIAPTPVTDCRNKEGEWGQGPTRNHSKGTKWETSRTQPKRSSIRCG